MTDDRPMAADAGSEGGGLAAGLAQAVPGLLFQFRLDPDGSFHVPFAAGRILGATGLTSDELRRDAGSLLDRLAGGDAETLLAALRSSARTMQCCPLSFRLRLGSGRTERIGGEGVPEFRDDGAVVWHGYLGPQSGPPAPPPRHRGIAAGAGWDRQRALALLDDLLVRARRQRCRVAVCLLDLDNFKYVNEVHGHWVGDEALEEVCARLAGAVRPNALLLHLGGDEFLVAHSGELARDEAERDVGRLLASLSEPFVVAGHRLHLSATAGIAVFPDDAGDEATLLRFADQAMHAAKASGRRGLRMFSRELQDRILEKVGRETALRRAVEAEDFHLFFQPQVDMASGRPVGAEALIRARDPALGGPAAFIPLAEENGLIDRLGDFSLRESCRQMQRWARRGGPFGRLAINVSACRFNDRMLVERVAASLRAYDLPPDMIEIEITETAAMTDPAETVGTLKALKALGVGIAIDDFGTGYSSLAYLRNFPVDRIKIDRSFIANLHDSAADVELVRAVLSLGGALGIEVVAEGVEREEHRSILLGLGCGVGQGYLFGRPQPASAYD